MRTGERNASRLPSEKVGYIKFVAGESLCRLVCALSAEASAHHTQILVYKTITIQ